MQKNTCSFFGHRTLEITEDLTKNLEKEIRFLIEKEGVRTFLFGSKSAFDDLCHTVVTTLKKEFPHIKRIYVRSEFPDIRDQYHSYLLGNYEETYFPKRCMRAGKAVYVERNIEMMDKSYFCIFYFKKDYSPKTHKKSGTEIAYAYAVKKKKRVINLAEKSEITVL